MADQRDRLHGRVLFIGCGFVVSQHGGLLFLEELLHTGGPCQQVFLLHLLQILGLGIIDDRGVSAVVDEVMACARLPAVQTRFVLVLVVGAAQHQAVLDPDQAAVQLPACLPEHGTEGFALGVCVEDVRGCAGAAGIVSAAICLEQKLPELAFVHAVVLDFLAVAALVVHVVGRVGDQQIRLFAAHERVDVPRVGAVADHQAVVAQLPDVANAAGGLLRQLHVVVVILGVTVHIGHLHIEAELGEVVVEALELHIEQGNVPGGHLAGGVICDAVCLDLLLGEVVGNNDRDFFQFELLGCLISRVPHDDGALLVHHDGLLPAEFFDAVRHRLDRCGVVSGIVVVGVYILDLPSLNLHWFPSVLCVLPLSYHGFGGQNGTGFWTQKHPAGKEA